MKPRIYKSGKDWVGQIGSWKFYCNTWQGAVFQATFHLRFPWLSDAERSNF